MRAILTYHSIDGSGSPVSIDAASFARQADWLARGSARVVPLAELQTEPAEHALALTFDDGFDNFAREGWPRLRDRGLPATLFVVSDHVGRTNLWGGVRSRAIPELPLLGWDELGRLAEEGVELGCHSRTHADLSRADPRRIEEELLGAREAIEERTGVRPRAFAYPFGRSSPAARELAHRYFDRACTTRLAVLAQGEDAHLLPRVDVYYFRGPGELEAFGGRAFRLRLGLRAGARRIRELIGSPRLPTSRSKG